MKRVKAVVLSVIMLCSMSFARSPEIAVFVTGELNSNEKRVLGAEILNALVRSEKFTAKKNSAAFMAEAERKQGAETINESEIYELGRQFGLRYICIADITMAFGSHQISARLIDLVDIDTAIVRLTGRASGQLNNMQAVEAISNSVVSNMLGIDLKQTAQPKTAPIQPAPPQPELTQAALPPPQLEQTQFGPVQPVPTQASIQVQDFTGAERLGTFAINVFIPGLGSGIIMKDSRGAWTQAGIFAGGFVCFLIPTVPTVLIGWTGIILVNPVYNIYRSVTYNKPGSQPMVAGSPRDFNFAVMPDVNGNLKTYAVYSISF